MWTNTSCMAWAPKWRILRFSRLKNVCRKTLSVLILGFFLFHLLSAASKQDGCCCIQDYLSSYVVGIHLHEDSQLGILSCALLIKTIQPLPSLDLWRITSMWLLGVGIPTLYVSQIVLADPRWNDVLLSYPPLPLLLRASISHHQYGMPLPELSPCALNAHSLDHIQHDRFASSTAYYSTTDSGDNLRTSNRLTLLYLLLLLTSNESIGEIQVQPTKAQSPKGAFSKLIWVLFLPHE